MLYIKAMCLWERVKKMKLIHGLVLSAAALFLSQSLMADEFNVVKGDRPLTLGLGVHYRDKAYRGYDSSEKAWPVPIILYEKGPFFARGNNIGWDFVPSEALEVAVIGEFINDGYEESDSDFLLGNGDKDASIGVGGQVIWKPDNLGFKFNAVTDVSGNSDGSRMVGDVFYDYKVNSSLMIKPSAQVIWQSDDYNDYYYGVRPRAVFAYPYQADSDVNYRLGVFGAYQQPDSPWLFMGGISYTFLGDEIKDSPIVSEDNELNALIGVAYSFK
jgi:outer membrane protein